MAEQTWEEEKPRTEGDLREVIEKQSIPISNHPLLEPVSYDPYAYIFTAEDTHLIERFANRHRFVKKEKSEAKRDMVHYTLQVQARAGARHPEMSLYCNVCNVLCNSRYQFEIHMNGIRHKAGLDELAMGGKGGGSNVASTSNDAGTFDRGQTSVWSFEDPQTSSEFDPKPYPGLKKEGDSSDLRNLLSRPGRVPRNFRSNSNQFK